MVEVDYLVQVIGCYKCRRVLFSSLHLHSPQYRNFFVPIPNVLAFGCFLTSNLRHSRVAEVSKGKNIEPIEMKRLWFDVTHLVEELLNAFG